MMGFNYMMGSVGSFWIILSMALMIMLVLGVVITILGIIKYSEDKKEGKLLVWGIALLLIPLLVWGLTMAVYSNNLFGSNSDINNHYEMMNFN